MSVDLEAAISRYINQWSHCSGKMLHAQNGQIVCDCGETWVWRDTLGETMEGLETFELTRTAPLAVAVDSNQMGFF